MVMLRMWTVDELRPGRVFKFVVLTVSARLATTVSVLLMWTTLGVIPAVGLNLTVGTPDPEKWWLQEVILPAGLFAGWILLLAFITMVMVAAQRSIFITRLSQLDQAQLLFGASFFDMFWIFPAASFVGPILTISGEPVAAGVVAAAMISVGVLAWARRYYVWSEAWEALRQDGRPTQTP
jgi:hypothetical protein